MRFIAIISASILIVIAWLLPPPAYAWGKFGHLTVCDLAYRNLPKTSRETLVDLLQSKQDGITVRGRGHLPDRLYTSFNVGCLEEDALPCAHEADHFINVGRNVQAISNGTCPGGGDCILSGIQRDWAILKDRSRPREERVFALMALGHWIGDIHQPLHVSFADDRGGNGIDADLDGKCGRSDYRVENPHGVWDNCLLESGLFEQVRQSREYHPQWSRFTITYRAVDTIQASTGIAEESRLVGTNPWIWANESYQLTIAPDILYCVRAGADCRYSPTSLKKSPTKRLQKLGQAYLRRHENVAAERIKRAGLRLAHLLNLALDPAYSKPVRNSTQPF